MLRRLRWVVCGVFFAATLFAAETPIPPAPVRWVTDTVGFMPPAAAAQLDARLQAYEQQTHHQLIVWIGKTSGDDTIDDWSARAVKAWGIGRKGANDGLALIVMADDRRLRIEVGYGLEEKVPDIIANRIITQIITPQIRSGNTGGAITAGMEAIVAAIGGAPLPGETYRGDDSNQNDRRQGSLIGKIITFIIIIFVLGFLVTHPSLMLMLLAGNIIGGGRRGGGWGGGGFGGGGGGFGGGGFSGGGG
ncbi:MAG TPA: TPM domain-containing protein, partial [Terriglobia bacterium]|nr:TPM domain-containing protein [Terriglobia bacterium]